jgi:pimeloyl-ACP methyl ester carboxylesterase
MSLTMTSATSIGPVPLHAVRNDGLQQTLSLLEGRFDERSVMVNGNVVSYRTCGRGPVVVLLHGIGSGAASWLDCALRLEPFAQVIAWNAPGYGRSTPLPMAQPSAADYAARLHDFLEALGVSHCVLVGHSLGAMMASAYVARQGAPAGSSHNTPGSHGKRVVRLLLLSPAQGYGSDAKRARGAEVAQQRLQALETLGVEGMAQRGPDRMLSPAASDTARDWVRWNMRWLDPAGYTQAVHMLCGDDIMRYAPPAGFPAAVYCGAADVVTTPQESRALAEKFGLSFDLFEAAGHACYVEQANAVAAAIRKTMLQPS